MVHPLHAQFHSLIPRQIVLLNGISCADGDAAARSHHRTIC